MGHSMGGVVASKLVFDFKENIKKSILLDPVLQPESLRFQMPFFNISNKFFISLLSMFKKNRASEMINNAKKGDMSFSIKKRFLSTIAEGEHLNTGQMNF